MIGPAQTLATPGIMRHGDLPGNNVARSDSMSIKTPFCLSGKSALITGGLRGLGLHMQSGARETVSRSAGGGAGAGPSH